MGKIAKHLPHCALKINVIVNTAISNIMPLWNVQFSLLLQIPSNESNKKKKKIIVQPISKMIELTAQYRLNNIDVLLHIPTYIIFHHMLHCAMLMTQRITEKRNIFNEWKKKKQEIKLASYKMYTIFSLIFTLRVKSKLPILL